MDGGKENTDFYSLTPPETPVGKFADNGQVVKKKMFSPDSTLLMPPPSVVDNSPFSISLPAPRDPHAGRKECNECKLWRRSTRTFHRLGQR